MRRLNVYALQLVTTARYLAEGQCLLVIQIIFSELVSEFHSAGVSVYFSKAHPEIETNGQFKWQDGAKQPNRSHYRSHNL